MAKCKRCGESCFVNGCGFCDTCYDQLKITISSLKDKLTELEGLSTLPKIDENNKSEILTEVDACCAKLQEYKRMNLPFFKSSFYPTRAKIYENLGVDLAPIKESPAKKTTFNVLGIIISVLLALCLIGLFASYIPAKEFEKLQAQLSGMSQQNSTLSAENATLKSKVTELEAAIEKYQIDLKPKKIYIYENGNFTAGLDFEPGTYDIEALKGIGNVSSDNMFSGGINAIMGTKSADDYDIAEQKYSNIELPDGTVLTIRDVKIRLTKVK